MCRGVEEKLDRIIFLLEQMNPSVTITGPACIPAYTKERECICDEQNGMTAIISCPVHDVIFPTSQVE